MTFRTFLLPAGIVATFLTGTVFTSQAALAQKGYNLAPVSQWAITKVDEAKANGQSYCAMAQRFAKNTVLTIAKNSNNESSFALDFQSPILKSSSTFNVVIDPGAGEQREYDISPVSSSAFVVRLGRDPKFFQALQKTGYLRVEVGRDVYNFDLSNIDMGQDELDGCLVSMIETAAGPVETKQSVAKAPALSQATTISNEGDLRALRDEIQTLRSENARLSNRLKIQEKAHDEKISEASNLSLLVERLQKLRSENSTLKTQLNDAQASLQSQNLNRDFAEELEDLLSENSTLQTQLSRKDAQLKNVRTLEDEILMLRQENKALQSLAEFSNDGHSQNIQEFDDMLAALEQENSKLKRELFEKKDDREVKALQALLLGLEDEKASLEDRIEEHKSLQQTKDNALDLLKGRIDSLKAENLALQKSVIEAADTSAVKSLEQSLAKAKRDKSLLESQLSNAKSAQELNKEQIELLNSKISRLEIRNEKLEEETQNAIGADILASVKNQLDDVRGAKLSLEADIVNRDKKIAEHEKSMEALSQTIADLEDNNQRLGKRLDEAADKSDYVALDKELQATEVQKEKLEQKVLELTQETSEKDVKLQELEASLAIFQNKSLMAQKTLDDTQGQAQETEDKMAKLRAENEALQKQYELAKQEISQSAISHEEAMQTLQSFEQEKKSLEGRLAELQNGLDVKLEELAALKTQAETYGATIEKLNSALEGQKIVVQDKDDQIAALHLQIETLESQNSDLQDKLQLALDDTELKNLEHILSTVKDENQSLQKLAQSNFEAIQKAQKLEAQLENLSAKNKTLEDEILAMDQIAEDSQKFVKNMQDEFQDLMQQIERKDEELLKVSSMAVERTQLANENEMLRLKLKNQDELEAEIALLKVENKALVAKAEAAQSQEFASVKGSAEEATALRRENDELRSMVNELSADDGGSDSRSLLLAYQENETLKTALEGQKQRLQELEILEKEFAVLKAQNKTLAQRSGSSVETGDAQDDLIFEMAAMTKRLEAQIQKNEDLEKTLKAKEQEILTIASAAKAPPEVVQTGQNNTDLNAAKSQIAQLQSKLKRVQKQNQKDLQQLAQENIQLKQLVREQQVQTPNAAPMPVSFTPKTPEQVRPKPKQNSNAQTSTDQNTDVQASVQSAPGNVSDEIVANATRMIDAQAGLRPQDIEPAAGIDRAAPLEVVNVNVEGHSDDFQNTFGGFEAQRQEQFYKRSLVSNKASRHRDRQDASRQQIPVQEDNKISQETAADIKVRDENPIESVSVASEPLNVANQKRPSPRDVSVRSGAGPSMSAASFYEPTFDLHRVLAKANIVDTKALEIVPHASNENRTAYQWKVQNVFGSAEQNPLHNQGEFENYVLRYLNKTQERCPGDFAVAPDQSFDEGRTRVDTYDIACVGGDVSSSASLLFFNHSGTFTAVAHESAMDDMDKTISLRERLVQMIVGTGSNLAQARATYKVSAGS